MGGADGGVDLVFGAVAGGAALASIRSGFDDSAVAGQDNLELVEGDPGLRFDLTGDKNQSPLRTRPVAAILRVLGVLPICLSDQAGLDVLQFRGRCSCMGGHTKIKPYLNGPCQVHLNTNEDTNASRD